MRSARIPKDFYWILGGIASFTPPGNLSVKEGPSVTPVAANKTPPGMNPEGVSQQPNTLPPVNAHCFLVTFESRKNDLSGPPVNCASICHLRGMLHSLVLFGGDFDGNLRIAPFVCRPD
jgi:hypothetical protein